MLLPFLLFGPGPIPADLVVLHANVLTPDMRSAQAFAVKGDKFIAIGSDKSISAYVGKRTVIWDLKGKTVVPGFNDAHLHPDPLYPEEAPYATIKVDPDHTPTMESLIARLKWKAILVPEGMWVTGSRYQETKLGRHPTCKDLDLASTTHPISISHSSGHLSVVNSLALKMAGITRDTKDPAGGAIGHFPDGEPNGLLEESAAGLVRRGRNMPKPSDDEVKEGYIRCFNDYAAKGITSAGVAGTRFSSVETWQELAKANKLPVRLNVMILKDQWEQLAERVKIGDFGNDRIRLASIKLFHGNSLSGHTCWVSEPYAGQPNYFGVPPAATQDQLNELVAKIHRAGLQICVHSNGDREIDMVLKAFAYAQAQFPRSDCRHRIEHCSIVTPELLKRIKAQGVIMVTHSYEWEHGDKMLAFGEKRMNMIAANRSALEMGIPIAGHSDSTVSAAYPLLRIQCMVTRISKEGVEIGPAQRISALQALRAWTLGSAFATHEEELKGTIETGKLADFVVLGENPLKVPGSHIKDIKIERTVVGGKTVYDAKGSSSSQGSLSVVEDLPDC